MWTKIKEELFALGMTLGASAITIMTFSGALQNWVIFFTVLSLIVHLTGVVTKKEQ